MGHSLVYLVHAGPAIGFAVLGAAFLAVTGGEAMYADMGHFGPLPIRLGWFAVVLPALALNYLGQGALLLADPQGIENPFYRLAVGPATKGASWEITAVPDIRRQCEQVAEHLAGLLWRSDDSEGTCEGAAKPAASYAT